MCAKILYCTRTKILRTYTASHTATGAKHWTGERLVCVNVGAGASHLKLNSYGCGKESFLPRSLIPIAFPMKTNPFQTIFEEPIAC